MPASLNAFVSSGASYRVYRFEVVVSGRITPTSGPPPPPLVVVAPPPPPAGVVFPPPPPVPLELHAVSVSAVAATPAETRMSARFLRIGRHAPSVVGPSPWP